MPRFGNVEVSDDFLAALGKQPAPPRPGLGAIFGAAAESTYGQVRYGVPMAVEKLAGSLSAEDDAFYKAGLARASEAASKAPASSFDDMTAGRVGFARWIGENLAASGPQSLGILAGGIGGGLAGGPAGALAGAAAVGTPMFLGSNVDRTVQEQGGLSSAAAERALFAAPIQAASDAVVDRFLPGAGRILGNFAAHQTGNFLARTAKSIVKAGATEAVTEAGQQMGERYAAGIPVTGPDAAAEYINAAVTAFAVGGVLGSAGGFRRSPAMVKPAAQVTDEDKLEHIDKILGLPAPTDITVDRTGQAQVNPNGTTQLALPSPDQFREPDVHTDRRGVSAVAPDGLNQIIVDQNLPRDSWQMSPELEDALARLGQPPAGTGTMLDASPAPRFDPTAPIDPRSSQASAIALEAGRLDGAPNDVTAAPPSRPLAGDAFGDLVAWRNNKTALPEVKAGAEDEIRQRYAEAAGTAPLTTDDYQQRVDELKHGLRGGFVEKLTAADPTELVDKLYTEVFENQNTQSNVTKLAQRAGLLDAKLEPTEAANQIEAARAGTLQVEAQAPAAPVGIPVGVAPAAPAAPATASVVPAAPPAPPVAVSLTPPVADPAFTPQHWNQLKLKANLREQAALKEVLDRIGTPVSEEDARMRVFRELAGERDVDPTDAEEKRLEKRLDKRGDNAAVTQLEKLAQHLGLITKDNARDITPLGHRTYLGTPEGRAEIARAADEHQKLNTGASPLVFDSGVRAELSGQPQGSFTSFEDLAAHQAGKVWARHYTATAGVKSAAETSAQMDRIGGRRELSEAQKQQQETLINVLGVADLSTVPDIDVTLLHKMIRDGATPLEVGRALGQIHGGKPLFREPATVPTELSSRPTRGQPIFKEMNTANAPQKAEQRVESEAAVRAYDLRNLIAFALAEKGITAARAQKLHDLLDQGKAAQVGKLLKDFDPDAKPKPRRTLPGLPTPPETPFERGMDGRISGDANVQLEQFLEGKSFTGVLDHLITHAPSMFHREIMKQVLALAKHIEKAGTKLDVKIVRPGDIVPNAINNPSTRALARVTRNPPEAVVWLKSTEMGPSSGMNYQMVAHEMLHAVTMSLLEYGNKVGVYGKTRLGKAVADLYELQHAISDHFNARAKAGNLSAFEQQFFERKNNSLSNVDEVLAWGLTNPDMQRYLQGIEYKPKQSVFGRLVNLLRNLLGLDGNYDTALTELLRVSERILGTRGQDLQATFVRNDPNGFATTPLEANLTEAGISAANRTVTAANDAVRKFAGLAGQLSENLPLEDFAGTKRRIGLGWSSMAHIIRQFGTALPALHDLDAAHRQAGSVRGRWSGFGDQFTQGLEALRAANPARAREVIELMAATTEHKLDPDKAFDNHTHLGFTREADGTLKIVKGKEAEIANLRRLHAELVARKNTLSRGDGAGYRLFTAARLMNEGSNLANLAAELHYAVASDRELTLGVTNAGVNPMDGFMARTDLTEPAAVRDHWADAVNQQIAAAEGFIRAKMGEVATGSAGEQSGMAQHLTPIMERIQHTRDALAGMARAPYFHLGRFGNNFGSATIRKLANGFVDHAAQAHVAQALADAGITNMQISTDNTNPKIYGRFKTRTQATKFGELMKTLHAGDWLDGELGDIKFGPRDLEQNYGTSNGLPGFLQQLISKLDTDPRYVPNENATSAQRGDLAARKQEAIQAIRDNWIEQQPDNAISKVLTARKNISGYDPDMERSFAHRTNVGAVNLGNVSQRAAISNAHEDLRAQVAESHSAANTIDAGLVSDVYGEVRRREATPAIDTETSFFDKMSSVAHGYFLGFSPAYAAIQVMQIGTGVMPELAKQHGFNKSFHALRRVSPAALAILKAAGAEASKLGPRHYGDVVLSDSALRAAGLNDRQLDFMRHMLATGQLDIGTAARAQAQVASGQGHTNLDTGLKYAAAFGLYTETFSRLVTALAAHDLHGGDVPASARYAGNVITEALYDYQSRNRARQLGKQGFLGPLTPLVTQFMSYSAFTLEKLYSEGLSAIGHARPGESAATTAQRAREARIFLTGHLVAMTALAGTLGLPFASVFASVLGRLVDAADDDDEPFDATAAYRNWLASVLGKDVAEMVARGLPRAAGFDISARVGEQDLLPFSDLINDKRSWQQATQAYFGRALGPAPDMTLGLLDAGEKFGQGDVLGGAKAMLPVALKGPIEAYRMTTTGYVDTKGRALPMTPAASAILWQLLGFSPAEKAEYGEARGDQQSRRVAVTRQANALRAGIVKAMVERDHDRAAELITRAQKFDRDNDAVDLIASLPGALQRQQSSQARARALKTPLGVTMQDFAGQRLTDYANVNYGSSVQ